MIIHTGLGRAAQQTERWSDKGSQIMDERITTYREYWSHHVQQHRRPGNRALHYLGSSSAIVLLAGALATELWWLIPGALVCGYVPAMIGDVWIERSPREKHHYPAWAIASDFRMLVLFLSGQTARTFADASLSDTASPNHRCNGDTK